MRAILLLTLLAGCATEPAAPVSKASTDYPPEMQAGTIGTEDLRSVEPSGTN